MTIKNVLDTVENLVKDMKSNDKSVGYTIKHIKEALSSNPKTVIYNQAWHSAVLIYKYHDLLKEVKHNYSTKGLEEEYQCDLDLLKGNPKKEIMNVAINNMRYSALNYFQIKALRGHKYVSIHEYNGDTISLPTKSDFDMLIHNLTIDLKKHSK